MGDMKPPLTLYNPPGYNMDKKNMEEKHEEDGNRHYCGGCRPFRPCGSHISGRERGQGTGFEKSGTTGGAANMGIGTLWSRLQDSEGST